ncbi:hypothetical protein [Streptococcus halichoeri]|uniref:hypothetical protein n=1 Tax=Streptococcus halichoeri TaxID=254785 RepID=UPI00135C36F0|nr:hypothetical protein [Streptococcus halichoeri]
MVDILKSLPEHDLAVCVILIGLVREARLWHKQILEHQASKKNKRKGQKAPTSYLSIAPFA